MNTKTWEYYETGDIVTGAEIEGIQYKARTKKATLYKVKWTCCERYQVISHERLHKRSKQDQKMCKYCGMHFKTSRTKETLEEEVSLDPPLPMWPVPAILLRKEPNK